MARRTILVTGGSDGIGAEAAGRLTAQGERVIVVGRSPEKTAAVAEKTGAEHLLADFAHLDDVRRLADDVLARVETIDVLANILHARGLHARFHDQGLSAVAFHPGVVATGFASSSRGLFHWLYTFAPTRRLMTTAEEGGAHLAWFLDGTPGQTWHSGGYYDERALTRPAARALDDPLVDGLWERSTEMARQTRPGRG